MLAWLFPSACPHDTTTTQRPDTDAIKPPIVVCDQEEQDMPPRKKKAEKKPPAKRQRAHSPTGRISLDAQNLGTERMMSLSKAVLLPNTTTGLLEVRASRRRRHNHEVYALLDTLSVQRAIRDSGCTMLQQLATCHAEVFWNLALCTQSKLSAMEEMVHTHRGQQAK